MIQWLQMNWEGCETDRKFPDTLSTCECSERDAYAGPQEHEKTRANHSIDIFSPHSVHGRIRNENLPKRLRSNTVCLSSEFLYVRTLSKESSTEHFLDGAVCFPEPNDFQFQLSKYSSAA